MSKKLSLGSFWGMLILALLNVLIFTFVCYAFPPRGHKWKVHDMSRPTPKIVTPGTFSTENTPGQPPSDAIIVFDGKDLTNWRSMDGSPAKWKVKNGYMESVKGSGYVRTLQNFGDCQLHIEWAAPVPAKGVGQGRGNSGVFLMGKYEIQVLDSYQNRTYADGQASAVYGQYPPLVNANRPPGEWQTYDIIFHGPRFDAKGELTRHARITVLHNGVLVQDNVKVLGPTTWTERLAYKSHPEKLPLSLQDHGNPVRYRNIWIRELLPQDAPESVKHKNISLSTEILDRYVGQYMTDFQMIITITRQGNNLMANLQKPTNQLLLAASEKEFFFEDVDARIVFQTSDDGVAKSLELTIGRSTMPAKKMN